MFGSKRRISEATSMRGVGGQRTQGAVALAGDTDSSDLREGAGTSREEWLRQRRVQRACGQDSD